MTLYRLSYSATACPKVQIQDFFFSAEQTQAGLELASVSPTSRVFEASLELSRKNFRRDFEGKT